MATGCFLEHRMGMLADDEGEVTYAVQYACADMPTYKALPGRPGSRRSRQTQGRFGGRFVAFRTLLEVVDKG
ncbi:MAG: DUF4286 family protein [Flavobacteriales bacterium]